MHQHYSKSETELTHMNRLYEGKCVIRNGVLFMEVLEIIRKIERHVFNIAERAGDFYGKLPRHRLKNAKHVSE